MNCRTTLIPGTNLFEVQDILSELDLILGNSAGDPHKIRHQRRHCRGECGEDSAPQQQDHDRKVSSEKHHIW